MGVVVPAVVVEEPDLVAHVDQRQPAVGEGDRVQQQHPPDAELDRERVAGVEPGLEPARDAAVPLVRASPVSGLAWKRAPRANEAGKSPA